MDRMNGGRSARAARRDDGLFAMHLLVVRRGVPDLGAGMSRDVAMAAACVQGLGRMNHVSG